MKKSEINATYKIIQEYHSTYLKSLGVVLPKLQGSKGYTKDALILVFLAQGYPDTKVVSKAELTKFIRRFYKDTNDVQQARHLAAQKGWYIKSGTRKDIASDGLISGEYHLTSLEKPYPGFKGERRLDTIDGDNWEEIKKHYGYRCAVCGSKEGEPNFHWPNTITVLTKGHMDPALGLTAENIIPQCEKCNRPDLNYWVYDSKGRVVKIANARVVDGCSLDVQMQIYERLYKKFQGKEPTEI